MKISLSNTKIDIVNTKFVVAILSGTIDKLTLLHCTESKKANNIKNDENTTDKKSNNGDTFTKFEERILHMKQSFQKIISQLRLDGTFTDFSDKSIAEKELNFLNEYNQNKTKINETCSLMSELEEKISNHHKHTETLDEIIIKCAIRNRFIEAWEKSRKDQNEHFYQLLIDTLQDEINEYSRKIDIEQRCILEIENYSLSEMEMHKAESVRWTEKFDVDINTTEIDIQVSRGELEAMKMNKENVVESIKCRDQEMINFIALKEQRFLEKDSELMKLIYSHKDHLLAKCRFYYE